MEFLYANFLNTTTQLTVTNSTASAANLFSTDQVARYLTSLDNSDLTTTGITVTFDDTTAVSRIAIIDTNAKGFRLFYNGSTANTFNFTNATSTSVWTGNAEADLFLRCATTSVSSITLQITTTMVADAEKTVGQFVISDVLYELPQIPNSSGYKPSLNSKQIVHELGDGGIRINTIRKKFSLDISMDNVPLAMRNSLLDIYNSEDPVIFCPFGTSSSWDGIFFEAVWLGPFDFYEFSDDAVSAGFSGTIRLRETPS